MRLTVSIILSVSGLRYSSRQHCTVHGGVWGGSCSPPHQSSLIGEPHLCSRSYMPSPSAPDTHGPLESFLLLSLFSKDCLPQVRCREDGQGQLSSTVPHQCKQDLPWCGVATGYCMAALFPSPAISNPLSRALRWVFESFGRTSSQRIRHESSMFTTGSSSLVLWGEDGGKAPLSSLLYY